LGSLHLVGVLKRTVRGLGRVGGLPVEREETILLLSEAAQFREPRLGG
jgi:hypothetical protein